MAEKKPTAPGQGGSILDTIRQQRSTGQQPSEADIFVDQGTVDPMELTLRALREQGEGGEGTSGTPSVADRAMYAMPEAVNFVQSLFGPAGGIKSALTAGVAETGREVAAGEKPDIGSISTRALLNAAPSLVGGAARAIPKAGQASVMSSIAGGRTADVAGKPFTIEGLRKMATVATREGASMSEKGIAILKKRAEDLVRAAVPLAAGSTQEKELLARAREIYDLVPEMKKLVDLSATRGFSLARGLAGGGAGGFIAHLLGLPSVAGAAIGVAPAVSEASGPIRLKMGEAAAGRTSRTLTSGVEPLIRALFTAFQAGPGADAEAQRRAER